MLYLPRTDLESYVWASPCFEQYQDCLAVLLGMPGVVVAVCCRGKISTLDSPMLDMPPMPCSSIVLAFPQAVDLVVVHLLAPPFLLPGISY